MRTYDTPGKQANRQLLFDLAKLTECRTYGTFWGWGQDSRMFAPHFDVLACEKAETKRFRMEADALKHGYRTFPRSAHMVAEQFDMFHADFDNTASPISFRELRLLAPKVDRWLAVTIANGHKLQADLQDEAAFGTIPAWLTFATGFTLEHLAVYQSSGGQTMWFAILQRREGRGNSHRVQPLQIAYSIRDRGYWASRRLYQTRVLSHHFPPRSKREKHRDHENYCRRRKPLSQRLCQACSIPFMPTHGRQTHCTYECRSVAYRKAWYAAHREEQIAAVRAWRAARKAAVSGTAAKPSIREEAA